MKRTTNLLAISVLCLAVLPLACQTTPRMGGTALVPPKRSDPYFAKFDPKPAPQPAGIVLKKGDQLAICGDSITEQRRYSRIMETYLTVCVPDLEISTRQYGWGGETASGFLARMTNDCLRFKPTVATTCYGMNDHRYRAYEPSIGDLYRAKSTAIIESFKSHGVRAIQGSPGCVGTKNGAGWDVDGVEAKNLNLCMLRNIGVEIAESQGAGFADVFWPMLNAGFDARNRYGTNYAIAGKDGVHPGWAGHLVMAYAFLRSFGLDGDIGTYTVDLKSGKATATKGHEVLSAKNGEVQITSSRYPFCATGDLKSDDSIRSAMSLVPFNQELNRLKLVVKNADAANYKVTWGGESKTYSAVQLQRGVNLASDFSESPFLAAFKKVDEAVANKQSYETKQIKTIFHTLVDGKYKTADEIKDEEVKRLFALRDANGKFDRDQIAAETEKTRAPLVAGIKAAFVPVTHTIKIEAE